ncbi:ECF-type sigma factor [Haliangium sp.]|uniref:ECF-type sigma factor n=1 Tax=Haliangium sp. TaxID=2663208 RepID=UPI003D135537
MPDLNSVTAPNAEATSTARTDQRMSSDELVCLLYDELRRLAQARLARLPPRQTLQPTLLVHEAYERLARRRDVRWNSRAHFFGAAAKAMRNILVDDARRRRSQRRGGDMARVDVSMTLPDQQAPLAAEDMLTLHEALERMSVEHPEHAELVVLRYFGGLTMREIATLHGVHICTVEGRWRFARAWLRVALGAHPPPARQ